MKNEQMMAVFSELLDNQKEILAAQKDELILLRKLSNEMEDMKISIQNQKAEIMRVDLKPNQQVVKKGFPIPECCCLLNHKNRSQVTGGCLWNQMQKDGLRI